MRILISGYFGFRNLGDEISLQTLLNQIINKYPIAELFVLVKKSSIKEYKNLYKDKNIKFINRTNLYSIVQTLIKCDFLISGPGEIFQDYTGILSIYYYLGIIALGILYKVKVIIFSVGISELKNLLSIICVKYIFNKCKYIIVRDKLSYSRLQKIGINNIILGIDLNFKIEHSQESGPGKLKFKSKTILGIVPYGNDKLNITLIRAAERFAKYNNMEIEIFPFYNDFDKNLIKIIRKQYPNIKIKYIKNYEDITKNIIRCRLILGMRYHSIILSLLQRVNVLAIDILGKMKDLKSYFPDLKIISREKVSLLNILLNLNSDMKNFPVNYNKEIRAAKLKAENIFKHLFNTIGDN